MLHPKFVYDHVCHAQPNCYLRGVRVALSKSLTNEICAFKKSESIHIWSRGIKNNRLNIMRNNFIADVLAPRYHKNSTTVLGSNLSYFRDDFISVNGYDETIIGWGAEDLDLCNRLRNRGLTKLYLKFSAVNFHLWHKPASRENNLRNEDIMRQNLLSGKTMCEIGVSQYL